MNGLRVLVAEDNKINQQMISMMLKPAGIEVFVVENGEEALGALEGDETFSLVIFDQHMPLMTGEEALRALRALNTSYANIPAIIVTGDDLHGDDEKYYTAGANACLSKPLKAARLLEVIQEVLG